MSHSGFFKSLTSFPVKKSVLAVSMSVFAAGTAMAQSTLLEEVVVTAQKREQSLQDVGIAVTAFSGDQLDAFGFTNSTELTAFTPGVHISGNNGGSTQQFTIRGATQNDFFDLAEAPNAVYVDEAYQASGQSQLFASFDVERVEILKGPQGTLFGRNATGGLVHYVTRKPTKETEAYADVTYGNYDQVRAEAAVSGAVTDTISVRLSGFHRSHDPILENIYTDADLPAVPAVIANPGAFGFGGTPRTSINPSSQGGQSDLWDDDQFAVRGQMLFEPNDDVEFSVSVQYAEQTPASGPYQNVATVGELDAQGRLVNTLFSNPSTNPNSCEVLLVGTTTCGPDPALDLDFDGVRPGPSTDFFGYTDIDGTEGLTTSTDHTQSDFDKVELFGITGKLEWDLGWAKMVSVTNYSDQSKRQSLDVDSGPGPQLIVANDSEIDWLSQELRLEGEEDRFRWIVGLYYLTIDGGYSQNLGDTIGGINAFGTLFGGSTDLFLDGAIDANLETDSYSFFAQVDFDISERLELNVGFRGIQEEKDYDFTSFLTINTSDQDTDGTRRGNPTILGPLFPAHTESLSDFLWSGKLGLNFAWNEDFLTYASINRGVKAGSCNAPLLTFLTPDQYCYDEEVLISFEAGLKMTFWDGKARVNFSAYHYDYNDYQVFQFIGTSGAVFNVDASYDGFELELFTNPVDNLDLVFGLGIIDPTVQDVNVAPGIPRDVEPSFTPETQFNALGRYTWPSPWMGGSLALQVDGNYASSSFHNINNFGTHRMDSYWRGNMSLMWTSEDERWEVSGFVDNFSDTRNQNIGFELSTVCGCDEQSFGLPRMYGARIRYNYF